MLLCNSGQSLAQVTAPWGIELETKQAWPQCIWTLVRQELLSGAPVSPPPPVGKFWGTLVSQRSFGPDTVELLLVIEWQRTEWFGLTFQQKLLHKFFLSLKNHYSISLFYIYVGFLISLLIVPFFFFKWGLFSLWKFCFLNQAHWLGRPPV